MIIACLLSNRNYRSFHVKQIILRNRQLLTNQQILSLLTVVVINHIKWGANGQKWRSECHRCVVADVPKRIKSETCRLSTGRSSVQLMSAHSERQLAAVPVHGLPPTVFCAVCPAVLLDLLQQHWAWGNSCSLSYGSYICTDPTEGKSPLALRLRRPQTFTLCSEISCARCTFHSPFRARSQSCQKRLVASSRLSVRSHGRSRLPLEGFSWNLIFENFSKICWENPSFIEIRQD